MARVVAVFDDLLLGSNVQGMLRAAGHEAELGAPAQVTPADADVLVVDLGGSGFDGIALVERLRAAGELSSVRTLGVYSHVHHDVKLRAEAAGFDLVVPRSRMAREGAALVGRLAERGRDTPGAATFRAPAEAYDRFVGRYGRELARALIAAAGVRPGGRALDVGCGPGALATELAAVLGGEQVAAVDPSMPFVDACRRRLPEVRVEVAAAEALPFGDAAFDHALAQLAVNFMTDPLTGVREMRRVTRSGGTVAAAVWDYAGEMTLLRRFWDAAVALDPSAAARDEGSCMPFCRPEELGELWSRAGLADVSVAPAVVSAGYDSFEDLWQPLELGIGPAGAYAVSLPSERRAALKQELRRRLGVGDDPFRLTARAWLAVGRVR